MRVSPRGPSSHASWVLIPLVSVFLLVGAAPALGVVLHQDLASKSSLGVLGDDASTSPAISQDGRYVACESDATNLVSGDTNGFADIFVRDRLAGTTVRVSVAADGTQGDADCSSCSISADGRYVAYLSAASDLVPSDTNHVHDLFVHDRSTGLVRRASVAWDGQEGDGPTLSGAVSGNGRYVVFSSVATNLIPGDTNGQPDVFVRDMVTNTTRIASVVTGGIVQGSGPSETASISYDGRYVVFSSEATNLAQGDNNARRDIFTHDFAVGVTSRLSVSSAGAEGNGNVGWNTAVSANGRYAVFTSASTNLVADDSNGADDVFFRDGLAGTTSRISLSSGGTQASGTSYGPLGMSPDGRYVTFASNAADLVAGDSNSVSDAFVRDNATGATERISVTPNGTQGTQGSSSGAISSDGHYAAFSTSAGNLVSSDTNSASDIFVAQLKPAASSITRSPNSSRTTYRRRRGRATFTLSASAKGDFGWPIAGARIYLQSSPNGRTRWRTKYALTTDASGRASHRFIAKSKSTTYYRWYLPTATRWLAYTTSRQKVIVR